MELGHIADLRRVGDFRLQRRKAVLCVLFRNGESA